IEGFGPQATEISGTLHVADGAVNGEGIEAIFLDGPIEARVGPAETDGYRARLDVDGEVTVGGLSRAFNLPLAAHAAGQTRWRGQLLLPSRIGGATPGAPFRIGVTSNLSGVALQLPEPFRKPPGAATSLQLDFAVDGDDLELDGHLGPTRRF